MIGNNKKILVCFKSDESSIERDAMQLMSTVVENAYLLRVTSCNPGVADGYALDLFPV